MNTRSIDRLKRADRCLGIPFLRVLTALRPPRPWPDPAPPEPRRILLVKLWGIGNLVMILPLVQAVRRAYPGAEIRFLSLEGNAELLALMPELDGLILLRPGGVGRTLASLAGAARALRRFRPDLVLDFEQFLRVSAILVRLSGASRAVGFDTPGQYRASAYGRRVPYREDRHMRHLFEEIPAAAGIPTRGLPLLAVPRSPDAAQQAEAFFQAIPGGKGPRVVLHPGSGDNFPGRRWPVERFARLAEKLVRETGARCVLTGSASERALAERCRLLAGVPVENGAGRLDLPGFIEVLARVDLLVTNDTAPAHIGAALGTPLIALYGPNTPERYGPLHPRARVFYLGKPCSPCLTNTNAKTSRCRTPECMLDIEEDEVFRAAMEILRSEGAETLPLAGRTP